MNSKVRKVINIIVDVLVVIVLLFSALTLTLALTSRASGGVPNVFGKSPIGVQTNSMHGSQKDSFDKDDLIICSKVKDVNANSFKEGDIITFQQDINGDGVKELVTHRIYRVNEDGSYWTKGDNNSTYDQDPSNSIVFPNKYYYDVLAVYHGTRIPKIGGFINLLQTQKGFFFVILLPMILFFIYQAIRVVLNAMAYSKEKGIEQAKAAVANAELTEEQKKRAIEEYLAAQKGEKAEAPEDPEPEDSEPQDSESQDSESEA